ncbi:hypothetical protein BDZ89DRAFT_1144310 [Hymenopellis radicata]|nr:hypothetical protein BDZ89DRAFT_1144310 [Hymenopellis radicata]
MTLTSAPVLPPELVWLIVEHIWDWDTLRICALVSRTWAIPCQRALFHDLHLYEYTKMIRLPAHLIHYPHLQGFIQHVSVDHISWDIVTIQRPRDKYLSSLTALFPLISHITSLAVTFDRCHNWDTHDQQFVEAFSAFLRRSESLKVLVINGLLNKRDLQQMFSFLDSTQVRRLSLHTEFQPAPGRVDFFDSTLSIARLPAVEFLRIDSHDAFELQTGLNLWLGQHLAMFPNLKHLEIVVYDALNLHLWFSGILQPATLRLESFRLVLTRVVDSGVLADSMPIYANLFDGLQFKHLQLHMLGPIDPYESDAPDIIDWFSAMFRHLVEAGSTIHFTELTFTFTDVAGPEWGSVDDVLSHAAFRGVGHIHFEEESHYERTLISKLEHPELVSAIRDAFPHLASRGVLCFK